MGIDYRNKTVFKFFLSFKRKKSLTRNLSNKSSFKVFTTLTSVVHTICIINFNQIIGVIKLYFK